MLLAEQLVCFAVLFRHQRLYFVDDDTRSGLDWLEKGVADHVDRSNKSSSGTREAEKRGVTDSRGRQRCRDKYGGRK